MTLAAFILQSIIYIVLASNKTKKKNHEYLNEPALQILLTILVILFSLCILGFIIMACLYQGGYRFIRQKNEQQMIVVVPSHETEQYKQFLQDMNQSIDASRIIVNQY